MHMASAADIASRRAYSSQVDSHDLQLHQIAADWPAKLDVARAAAASRDRCMPGHIWMLTFCSIHELN